MTSMDGQRLVIQDGAMPTYCHTSKSQKTCRIRNSPRMVSNVCPHWLIQFEKSHNMIYFPFAKLKLEIQDDSFHHFLEDNKDLNSLFQ